MEVSVTRDDEEVTVVMRESIHDVAARTYPAWILAWEQDGVCDFNVWTMRIPVAEAGILMRGLQEAGVR
jgi:hypothetical protein